MTVKGVVQGVGTKYNGSVLVNDVWYNFKKGLVNGSTKGDMVVLTLEAWEFKGKTGHNIKKIEVLPAGPVVEVKTEVQTLPIIGKIGEGLSSSIYKERDFNAENRGKTRCQLVAASMPLLLNGIVDADFLKEQVNLMVDFIFDGK